MKYMYIGKTVLDNLYFCVCFMCSVGVQQWADAILTAILGPYLTCMNKHKFIINSKTNLSLWFIILHVFAKWRCGNISSITQIFWQPVLCWVQLNSDFLSYRTGMNIYQMTQGRRHNTAMKYENCRLIIRLCDRVLIDANTCPRQDGNKITDKS